MDFLKGLFSSKPEDQGVSNIHITESGSSEPTQEEPQMPEEPQSEMGNENAGEAEDSSIQE